MEQRKWIDCDGACASSESVSHRHSDVTGAESMLERRPLAETPLAESRDIKLKPRTDIVPASHPSELRASICNQSTKTSTAARGAVFATMT